MLKFSSAAFVLIGAAWATHGIASTFVQQPPGHVWTQQEVFRRNVGSREEQTTAFPPHKVVANIYDVQPRGEVSEARQGAESLHRSRRLQR